MSVKRWLLRGGSIMPVLEVGASNGWRILLTAGGSEVKARERDLYWSWNRARDALVGQHARLMRHHEAEMNRAREAKRSAEQMKRRPWSVGFGEELEKAQD